MILIERGTKNVNGCGTLYFDNKRGALLGFGCHCIAEPYAKGCISCEGAVGQGHQKVPVLWEALHGVHILKREQAIHICALSIFS